MGLHLRGKLVKGLDRTTLQLTAADDPSRVLSNKIEVQAGERFDVVLIITALAAISGWSPILRSSRSRGSFRSGLRKFSTTCGNAGSLVTAGNLQVASYLGGSNAWEKFLREIPPLDRPAEPAPAPPSRPGADRRDVQKPGRLAGKT